MTRARDVANLQSGAIINEAGADLDFRIESDGNANMLFVDAGNNCVNIGTTTNHGGEVNIETTGNATNLALVCTDTDANAGPFLVLRRDAGNVPSDDDAMGAIIFENDDTDLNMTTYAKIDTSVRDVSNGSEAGRLNFHVASGGSETKFLGLIGASASAGAQITFNEDSNTVDFRIESDDNAHMFFLDATNNRISIGGQSAPQRLVHIKEDSDTATEMVLGHPSGGNEYGGFIRSNSGTAQGLTLGGYFNGTSTERLKIDGNGNVLIRETNIPSVSSSVALQIGNNTNNDNVHLRNATSSGAVYCLFMKFDNYAPDDNTSYFIQSRDSSAIRFVVYSDGDVQNHDNSYSGISDEKLKEQIKDASSQWDDVKALRIRKYKMKEEIANKGDSDNLWKLGVVAQEVEASGMSGLVTTNKDVDDETKEDLGTTTKAVKYSILYMKAVKALQEAMTRIETLEAKVAKLEGA
jgi:hypothetical protein